MKKRYQTPTAEILRLMADAVLASVPISYGDDFGEWEWTSNGGGDVFK